MNVSFSRAPNFCRPFIQWLEQHRLAETPFSEWTYSSELSFFFFFLCRGLFVPSCSAWPASKYVLEVLLRGAFGNRLHGQAYVLKTSQTTWPDSHTAIKPRLCSPIVARGGRAQRSPRKKKKYGTIMMTTTPEIIFGSDAHSRGTWSYGLSRALTREIKDG